MALPREKPRLEAFSDGVFAIVITLLVLELVLPELHNHNSAHDLFEALWSIRGRIASYFICFLFVGQLWVAHSHFFRMVKKVDVVVYWLNILLLMFVCLQPFVMAILGEYPDNPGSVLVFGVLFTATGAVFSPMAWYCRVKGFFHVEIDHERMQSGLRFMSAIALLSLLPPTFVFASPRLALAFYVLLMFGYIFGETHFRLQEREGSEGATSES